MWRPKSVSFSAESKVEESLSIHPERQSVGILPHSRLGGIPSIHHQHHLIGKKCSPVLTPSYGSLGQLEVSCHRASSNPSPPMPSLRSLVCRNRTQQSQQAAVTDAPAANGLPCIPPEGETSLKRDVSCASLGHSRVGYPDLTIRKSETAVGLSSLAMDDHSQKGDQCSADGGFVCPNQKGLVLRALNRKEREMLKPFVSSRNLITREISASTRNLLLPLRREFSASCTSSASPSFPSPSATSPLLLLQNSGGAESVDGDGPMRPVNRLRMSCSRCSSLVSLSASRLSLGTASPLQTVPQEEETFEDATDSVSKLDSSSDEKNEIGSNVGLTMILDQSDSDISSEVPSSLSQCKLCLTEDIRGSKLFKIQQCGCLFCQDCMHSYVQFEIQAGAYDISCPDAQCPTQGVITITEIETLVGIDLTEKHRRFRLYREVDLDVRRVWCPVPGCETVCTLSLPPSESSTNLQVCQPSKPQNPFCMCPPQRVVCPTCNFDFCSACRKPSHVGVSCEKAAQLWGGRWSGPNPGTQLLLPPGVPPDSELIKCCPMCCVPIEKDEGCAQMMCKRCKHVFCWYCLTSLDDDFLLRHYDKGPCKNKLGHSRASVIWHRAQVIGIFAGFGILLLVASPLLLLAAPCIVCCKCRVCTTTVNGTNGEKLEEEEEEEGSGESIGIVAGKVAAHGLKTNSAVNEIQEVTQGNS